MKRNALSIEDNKRGYRASMLAALLAVVFATSILSILFGNITDQPISPIALTYGASAGLGAWLAVRFFWKRLIRDGETRKRGAFYGAFAAFFSLLLMSFLVTFGSGLVEWITHRASSQILRLESIIMVPFMSIMLTLYAFIFGGFLTIPIGAVAGYMLTKKPE